MMWYSLRSNVLYCPFPGSPNVIVTEADDATLHRDGSVYSPTQQRGVPTWTLSKSCVAVLTSVFSGYRGL